MFDNKISNILLVFISVLATLWITFYVLPDLFSSLFHTILGNILLVLSIVYFGSKNIMLALALVVIYIVLFKLSHDVYEGAAVNPKLVMKKKK